MNAIMGMYSIAKKNWDDPDRVRDCLDKVENSARFLLALINDILDMSKIESGKAILKKSLRLRHSHETSPPCFMARPRKTGTLSGPAWAEPG